MRASAPTDCMTAVAICFLTLVGSTNSLVMKDQPEACSLSRPMMLQSVSGSLQHGIGVFWPLLPALPSFHLAVVLPVREQYGLTTFHTIDTTGLGSLCPPTVLDAHDGV